MPRTLWVPRTLWAPRTLGAASGVGQLGQPLLGVGLVAVVDRGDGLEPAARVVASARAGPRLGVGVPEPHRPRLEAVTVQGRPLQADDRGFVLAAVAPRAGGDDRHLHP